MTRTFVVGDVPEDVADWHRLCKEALDRAISEIKDGADGRAIFDGTCEIFEAAGEPTQRTKEPGKPLANGFFHGLGHGVGLEVHEQPGLGLAAKLPLVAGDVVTVEPGCYRAGLRRRSARGPRARDRGRRREPDAVPLRPRARDETRRTSTRCSSRSGGIRRRRSSRRRRTRSRAIYEEDFEAFWEREGRERVAWFEPFTKLYEWEPPYAKWYLGGKLNVA